MSRKLVCLLVGLLLVSPVLAGDVVFTDGGGNHIWGNGANWDTGVAPVAGDIAYINTDSTTGKYALVQAGDNINVARIRMSQNLVNAPNTKVVMTGGAITATSGISIGNNHFYDDPTTISATFDQGGGDIVCGDYWRVGYRTGVSTWLLRDGTITAGRLLTNATAAYSNIEIGAGSYSVKYDRVSTMLALVADGVIRPYMGVGTIMASFDPDARDGVGETTVWCEGGVVPEPATLALLGLGSLLAVRRKK